MIRSLLPLAVLGVVLAGCSAKEGGTATPGSTAATTTGTSAKPTTTSAGGGDGLASFDPCAAMKAAAGQVPLTDVENDGKQECKAQYGSTVSVRVKAFPSLGIADVVGGANSKFTEIPVGNHKGRRVTAPVSDSSCAVAIEITPKSRVDVVASANASQDEACDAATKVATAIEPKLPK
ncbi:DUF3558 family protein [Saccharothrix variisporea]|uniref:DUF3558 family protein n=1 Tax=Saccharothrix variisporea TaxID=543527 RepID=UPI0037C697A9